YYSTFDSFLSGLTNGLWSILVTNSTSTNQYRFQVQASALTSNVFGEPVLPIFPVNGAQFITNQPVFLWSGPTNWQGTLYAQNYFIDTNGFFNYVDSAFLPTSQTSWMSAEVLPDGTNRFNVDYTSNATALVFASTPTNNAGQPISSWASTAALETR